MAVAPIVGGRSNLGAGEPFRRQELCGRARAQKHRDLPATRQECLNHSREHGDTEAARDADCWLLTIEVEAEPEWAEQVDHVTFMANGQPGAPRTHDVEDEPDPPRCPIGPGGAI